MSAKRNRKPILKSVPLFVYTFINKSRMTFVFDPLCEYKMATAGFVFNPWTFLDKCCVNHENDSENKKFNKMQYKNNILKWSATLSSTRQSVKTYWCTYYMNKYIYINIKQYV